MIRRQQFRTSRNDEFTPQQQALGQKLAELIDQNADEALIAKEFSQDSLGQFFAVVGLHKVKLDSGEVVTVPDVVHVPTPAALQPEPAKRGVVNLA